MTIMKKKRLGRGLGSLIGNLQEINEASGSTQADGMAELDIDRIQRGRYQPRQVFEQQALQELADSIRAQGIVQPIVVRPEGNHFELIAGERRWRASQLAGLAQVPAVVKRFDDQTAAAVSLIENIQRENLNPLEESTALQRLMIEFEMTHQQIADTVARSRAAVSNLLRLQDLNPDVKELLSTRVIDMGHARA